MDIGHGLLFFLALIGSMLPDENSPFVKLMAALAAITFVSCIVAWQYSHGWPGIWVRGLDTEFGGRAVALLSGVIIGMFIQRVVNPRQLKTGGGR